MGEVMHRHHAELLDRHPCVGAAGNIGLFGILELIRDRSTGEPMALFNGASDEMRAIERDLLDRGLYTMVRWWSIMTNPPPCIDEERLAEGFSMSWTKRSRSATGRSATEVELEARARVPRFSANLSFLWNELPVPRSVRRGGGGGFDAVEYMFR